MEYAANLLNPRTVLVPAIALVIGAGGAIGVYAALDDTDVSIEPTRVVVADPPAAPTEGVAAKHEAATAAAISTPDSPSTFAGKDEAASAAAIATSSPRTWLESKDEAGTAAAIGAHDGHRGGGPPAEDDQGVANRTDPHGPAAALP
jgi:hypothetical protein